MHFCGILCQCNHCLMTSLVTLAKFAKNVHKSKNSCTFLGYLGDETWTGLFLVVLHHPLKSRQVQLMCQTCAFCGILCQCNYCLMFTLTIFAAKACMTARVTKLALTSMGDATHKGLFLFAFRCLSKPRQVQPQQLLCAFMHQTSLV